MHTLAPSSLYLCVAFVVFAIDPVFFYVFPFVPPITHVCLEDGFSQVSSFFRLESFEISFKPTIRLRVSDIFLFFERKEELDIVRVFCEERFFAGACGVFVVNGFQSIAERDVLLDVFKDQRFVRMGVLLVNVVQVSGSSFGEIMKEAHLQHLVDVDVSREGCKDESCVDRAMRMFRERLVPRPKIPKSASWRFCMNTDLEEILGGLRVGRFHR